MRASVSGLGAQEDMRDWAVRLNAWKELSRREFQSFPPRESAHKAQLSGLKAAQNAMLRGIGLLGTSPTKVLAALPSVEELPVSDQQVLCRLPEAFGYRRGAGASIKSRKAAVFQVLRGLKSQYFQWFPMASTCFGGLSLESHEALGRSRARGASAPSWMRCRGSMWPPFCSKCP